MVLHQEEEWLTQDRPRPPTSQRRHKLQRFHPTLCRSVEGMAARSCYSMLDLFRLRSLCSQHFFPRPHYIPDLSAHVGAQFSLKDQLTRSQSFTAKSLFSWSPKSTKSPSLFSMVLPSVPLLLSMRRRKEDMRVFLRTPTSNASFGSTSMTSIGLSIALVTLAPPSQLSSSSWQHLKTSS